MRRYTIALVVVAWCAAVGVGLRELYAYTTAPGAHAANPAEWPADTSLRRSEAGFTLVMFVHPECACSRASLSELAAIARTARHAPTIVVAVAADRAGGTAWDLAGDVPGAMRVLDPGGREALRFGAVTSGLTLVYDARGALRFAGGITGSRGHAGDNVGRRSVLEILDDGATSRPEHPVFGCELFGEVKQ